MNDNKTPVAYSLRFHEKQLTRINRFLGQFNLLWASSAILILVSIFWLRSDEALVGFMIRNVSLVVLGWVCYMAFSSA